ncbi:MAG: hypothetical protein OXN27_04235 [Candidatus Poribacteria bacterium]|nr:hypothetical protein [Candidatus Poribacteria bacterium]
MTFRTFLSKAFFIPMFVVIGAASFLWFSQRETKTPEVKKVYKAATPSQMSTFKGDATSEHTHTESHTHPTEWHARPGESPGDHFARVMKETFGESSSPKMQRFLAYLESKEGRAFMDSFPSFDELIAMQKRFGFFQESALDAAVIDGKYREHFPIGTVDENEPIIRDLIAEVILDAELHKDENPDRHRTQDVRHYLLSEDKIMSWLFKKFGTTPLQPSKWLRTAMEETRLAEREKFLAAGKTAEPPQLTDVTEPVQPLELKEEDGFPSDKTLSTSELERAPQSDAELEGKFAEQLAPDALKLLELPTEENSETTIRERFSPERFNRAMQTLSRHGPEEGLRKLKETDPEIAKHVERLINRKQEGN